MGEFTSLGWGRACRPGDGWGMLRRMRRLLALTAMVMALPAVAAAQPPGGVAMVRLMGSHAREAFAPVSGQIGALVKLPAGTHAADLGLDAVAPGIGRLRGDPQTVVAFGAAHPDLQVEVSPPLHTLLLFAQKWTHVDIARKQRGADGAGTLVGIADTGLDPTLPDFRDPVTNKSRVAWMLDLSMKPLGKHPELEDKYGVKDQNGVLQKGAVLTGADIDELMSTGDVLPEDDNGHGTHVASIAAGNGGGTPYIGMAPNAGLIIVRVTRDASGTIENDDSLRGAQFIFDRGDAMGMPVVANFSLGTDFGSHDGNSLWEQTLASYVGPDHPGHALVAAAGNSGSILDTPIHQSVHVTDGPVVRVPVTTYGAQSGAVQIWVALRPGADMNIGLDGPDGSWIGPVSEGNEQGKNGDGYNAGVIYGSGLSGSPVPEGSRGAVVLWSGKWPAGTYAVTLSGHGIAELYLQGTGDAALEGQTPAHFSAAVREGTINLPATAPGIIGVGCSVNSPSWKSQAGQTVALTEPVLDDVGGGPADPSDPTKRVLLTSGEICYFSSAGPNVLGVPKPDIVAPGAAVIGAMSQKALPGEPTSIFTTQCPPSKSTGKVDPRCLQVDDRHAVAQGTSMSSPMVAGVIALLFQQDPTLTEDELRALLQTGAHRFRGPAPFYDQAGVGELDGLGALDALDEMHDPALALPSPDASWLTLSADYATADGSTPLTAILELRSAEGKRAALFDISRLQPIATVLGRPVVPAPVMTRGVAPGLFTFRVTLPPGLGGKALTLGASFDGQNVVQPVTIPIATDAWSANYTPSAKGACSAAGGGPGDLLLPLAAVLGLALVRRKRA